jgi:Polyketide cyclase / dehydrase and lipid transport
LSVQGVNKERIMAKSYFSTVFEQDVGTIWSVVRNFDNYAVWVDGAGETVIEDGKSGDTVGAVRNVLFEGRRIRQRLLAHSDADHFIEYEYCAPVSPPVRNYRATLRVTPVVDGDRAFIEWWAIFDCDADQYEHWTAFYEASFAKWLGSLRRHLTTADGSGVDPSDR